MKTRESIEASQDENPAAGTGKKPFKREGQYRGLIAPWNSETAPRNGGRPKKDMSAEIAKQVFENNPELIYKACVNQLAKGGAFAFQVYSDRAFGKLKEKIEVSSAEEVAALLEAARKRIKK